MAEHKDEGLIDKILTLVAPPLPPSSQKGRGSGKKSKANQLPVPVANAASGSNLTSIATTNTLGVRSSSSASLVSSAAQASQRHLGMQNHSYCDACGDGGSLLCCDNCPTSFHFNCCDPPVDPRNIPSGDWLCRKCREDKVPETLSTLFQPLVRAGLAANPLVFNLPYELQRKDILPGCSRKELKQARLIGGQLDREAETRDVKKSCYKCNKGTNVGRMASCDFCPLMFHLDCLEPPLTIPPTVVWMCPIHPNNRIPGFDHPRLSERLKALERGQANIPYHTIKADFIRRVRKIPPYKRVTRHHNRRVTAVPASIKSLYAHPIADVSQILPVSDSLLTPEEDVQRWRREEEAHRKQVTALRIPTVTHDQDEWTRNAIQCQLHNSRKPSLPTATNSSPSPSEDVSMLLAAQQLLELSKTRVGASNRPDQPKLSGLETGKHEFKLNGLVRPHSRESIDSDSRAVNGDGRSVETNGRLSDSVSPKEGSSEKDGPSSETTDGKPARMELGDDDVKEEEGVENNKYSLNGNGVLMNDDDISEDGEVESCDETQPGPYTGPPCATMRTSSVLDSDGQKDDTEDGRESLSVPPGERLTSPHSSRISRSVSPRPSQTSRTVLPRPSQTSRTVLPHPSQTSGSASPHPSQTSGSVSTCPSQTSGSASPRPSPISRSASPRPSQRSVSPRPSQRSVSPRPSQISKSSSPQPSKIDSLESVEDMEVSNSDCGGSLVSEEERKHVDGQTGEEPVALEEVKSNSWEDIFVPDLSQLNPKMVELLALQRISQLLSDSRHAHGDVHSMETANTEPLTSSHGQVKVEEEQISSGKKSAQQAAAEAFAASTPVPPYLLRLPSKTSLLSASAILCPLSGTACAALLDRPVVSVGLGSEVDINLMEFGHCDFVSPRQACIFYDQHTRDYELINYSEHGTVVDGVLYSCDFSNKAHHNNAPCSSNGYFTANGMTTPLHRNTTMHEADKTLQQVRKSVWSREDARRAVERAIRMATPIKDDLSLAEEMSKCEGLMTRTGLKRVAAESANSHAQNPALPGSSTFLSIPLSKTKKSESVVNSPPRKLQISSKVSSKLYSRVQNSPKRQSVKVDPPTTTSSISPCHQSCTTLNSENAVTADEPMEPATCDCRGSLTSLVGSNGKGWEGTATLTHGSRLRFGCLQFILSITGQPGHSELIQALSSIHESNFD